jgi:hypothetical protein
MVGRRDWGDPGERKLVQLRIGMEATGNSQWFIELVQDLGHEIWIGDAAHAGKKLITSPRRPPILALAIAPGDSKNFLCRIRRPAMCMVRYLDRLRENLGESHSVATGHASPPG